MLHLHILPVPLVIATPSSILSRVKKTFEEIHQLNIFGGATYTNDRDIFSLQTETSFCISICHSFYNIN